MARRSAERPVYRVQVLERAVDILQVLSEDSRELAAGEVAERLSLHKSPSVNPNALRPYLGFAVIGLAENTGDSRYHGLQLSVERRVAQGLHAGLAYTYSRAMDDSSNLTDVLPNTYDDSAYWGISDNDRPHVLIVNYMYELPFGRGTGWVAKVLGNWDVSGGLSISVGLAVLRPQQRRLRGRRAGQRRAVLEPDRRCRHWSHRGLHDRDRLVQQGRLRPARGRHVRRPAAQRAA